MYCTIQEGQTSSTNIFSCELDVTVHSIDMICEGFHFLYFNFDPGVIYVPEPAAGSSSCEGAQSSASSSPLHVEIGHNKGNSWTHSTAVLLSVKTLSVFEIGGSQAEVR